MKSLAMAAFLALPLGAADTDSIDSVTRAVYEVISGPPGARDWDRFRSLFSAGARLITFRNSSRGPLPSVMVVDEYIRNLSAATLNSGFFESEIARRVESYGNIAHVLSTYESRHAAGEKPFGRGLNSFQVVRDGNGWKVITILWDAEREGAPLPEKYLKP